MSPPYHTQCRTQRPDGRTYGAYLDDLLAEMQRRPSLLYLASYLRNYGRRRVLLPYAERDATPPDLKAIHARGCDWSWHQRQWDYREHARAIIEGVEPWPRRLLPWKNWLELRYYHGKANDCPAWLDPANERKPSPWTIPGSMPALPSKKRARQ